MFNINHRNEKIKVKMTYDIKYRPRQDEMVEEE